MRASARDASAITDHQGSELGLGYVPSPPRLYLYLGKLQSLKALRYVRLSGKDLIESSHRLLLKALEHMRVDV